MNWSLRWPVYDDSSTVRVVNDLFPSSRTLILCHPRRRHRPLRNLGHHERRRVAAPARSIPREKIYHPLREQEVPAEILHHPRARRFFRFVREEVELPQRRLRVIEHYQEVIVVDDDDSIHSTLQTANVPEPVLDRCYVGPSLLAYLAVSRFADHIPYYREEDILARTGFTIHRSTQWRWMRGLAKLLEPLVKLIRQRTLQSYVLGIDETPCPLICPELDRTRSSYLYAQYGDAVHPYDCFYSPRTKLERTFRPFWGIIKGICSQTPTSVMN